MDRLLEKKMACSQKSCFTCHRLCACKGEVDVFDRYSQQYVPSCSATPTCYLNSIATAACFTNFQILFKVSQLNENCCMLLLNTQTLHHCQDLSVIVSTNMSWTKTNNVITKNHTESLISFAAAFSYSN